MAKVIPLSCFIKPNSLYFAKSEVAVLTKTNVENIVKIHHWRYCAWVERVGCLPVTLSYRRLSCWLSALRDIIYNCKSWRRLCKFAESLEADFVKYPHIYSKTIQQELRNKCDRRRAQISTEKPRNLYAQTLTASYEEIIRATAFLPCLNGLLPLIGQHEVLWRRYPHLLEQLQRAWGQRRDYLQGYGIGRCTSA